MTRYILEIIAIALTVAAVVIIGFTVGDIDPIRADAYPDATRTICSTK